MGGEPTFAGPSLKGRSRRFRSFAGLQLNRAVRPKPVLSPDKLVIEIDMAMVRDRALEGGCRRRG